MGKKKPKRCRSIRRDVRFRGLSRRAHIVQRRLESERQSWLSQSLARVSCATSQNIQLTLQKSRSAVWDELDQDLATAVYDQTVERRLFLIFEQLIARLMDATFSFAQQFDRVSIGVSQQEPASDFDNGSIVGVAHWGGIEAVQRHGRRTAAAADMARVLGSRCGCAE
jgi:hypothetical protein